MTAHTQSVQHQAQRAAQEGKDWLEPFARAGYAARGAVYVLVGGLAMYAAFGPGEAQGSRGALASISDATWGVIILALVGIGLLGYAAWRFTQGFLDADNHGTDGKGLVVRAGLVVSGVTHVTLGIYALTLAVAGGGSSDSGGGGWTAQLMGAPAGRWLVGFVGACIVGAGVAQFVKGYKTKFRKWLDMRAEQYGWAIPMSRFGLIARGTVFGMIGGWVIYAALTANPEHARGLGEMLRSLQGQPYGPWLLAIVALGLLAFAGYSFLEAAYRRINP